KTLIKDRLQNEATRSQRELLSAALVQLLALRYKRDEIAFWRDLMATLDISKTDLAEMFREEGRLEQTRADVLRMGRKKFGVPARDRRHARRPADGRRRHADRGNPARLEAQPHGRSLARAGLRAPAARIPLRLARGWSDRRRAPLRRKSGSARPGLTVAFEWG